MVGDGINGSLRSQAGTGLRSEEEGGRFSFIALQGFRGLLQGDHETAGKAMDRDWRESCPVTFPETLPCVTRDITGHHGINLTLRVEESGPDRCRGSTRSEYSVRAMRAAYAMWSITPTQWRN